uniref:Putative secreted protein n=1 Tax=Ixodes ricinus TaxID=34613 RepID=A0A6B0U895_IXORI
MPTATRGVRCLASRAWFLMPRAVLARSTLCSRTEVTSLWICPECTTWQWTGGTTSAKKATFSLNPKKWSMPPWTMTATCLFRRRTASAWTSA